MTQTIQKSVPFADFRRNLDPIRGEVMAAIEQIYDRCDFILGEEVRAFEEDMARWLGVQDVCATANATTGMTALIRAFGIGPGDEVITTVHTAIATGEAITLAGAQVVFADIDNATHNLDPADVEKKITPRTKAIIAVHLYGHPAALKELAEIAASHKLVLIEDCAQAQGARFRGNRVGAIGDGAVFSFFPSKTLGGIGDGGAITAKDPKVLLRARMDCNHGRTEKYVHEFEGTNSRLDSIKAAFLRIALRHLDEWNTARQQAAAIFDERLAGIDAITLPVVREDCTHVYMNYIIRTARRDELAAFLKEHGVNTGLHYPMSLNQQPAYKHLNQGDGHFPVAERACAEVLSLPMFPGIEPDEVATICLWVRAFFA